MFLKEFIRPSQGGKVIDLGCGNNKIRGAYGVDVAPAPGAIVYIETPHYTCTDSYGDPCHLWRLNSSSLDRSRSLKKCSAMCH